MFFEKKDGIVYKTVTGNDYCQVARLLCDSFYSATPLSWPLGGPLAPAEVETVFPQLSVIISHRVSILAFDADTKEIVGVRLSVLSDRESRCSPSDPLLDSAELAARYPKHSRLVQLEQHLDIQADCLARYRVSRAMIGRFLAVKESHANRGIGGRLVESSVRLAKVLRIPLVIGTSHNVYSHRIYRSLGFDCIYSVQFRDYTDKLDGEKPFVALEDTEHSEAAVFAYRL
ncbi:hypothetical protein BOX15_Mlig013843g2 [Macrostomum lignano]|uniref:N-acetyltransferase domain-containing protein n=1 Tax=Macrostomum lignano TaxID=282301 RepID=A0A267ERM5_9PLAT|nr:hypothetical protein BOX15_Mlig013843g2 [Macrostomum lignano]